MHVPAAVDRGDRSGSNGGGDRGDHRNESPDPEPPDSLFRKAHENSPDPFELLKAVKRDGRVVDFVWQYVNPAAAALLGRSAAELLGRHLLGEADTVFGAVRCAHWVEVLEHRAARRASFSRVGHDGSTHWYDTMSLPVADECIAATTRDATAQASETQRRGQGWNDDLLASVSHELRTPLNAIVGWTHLLGRPEADAALTQRAAEAIGRNAQALASLVDDLLDINRIVTGTLRLERQPCDVAAAVRRAVDAVRPAAKLRWIHLDTEAVAAALPCRGDARRLEQLLGNLLTRAVQSTPLDGAIHVAATARDGQAVIHIRDTGEGIAGSEQPHGVERVGQADSAASRKHGGLGLGLSIVRSLVELHGGRMSVASDGLGLGTAYEVELPLDRSAGAAVESGDAAAAESSAAAAAATATVANADLPLAWRRILVLEDEADSLELMTVLLRQQGAIVQAFDNAEQALAAAENGSFDLIISDLGMAGMDGLEFMRRLKRRPVPIKAMALTAYAGDAHRALALEAGYSRVEIKPISPPEFLRLVCAEAGRAMPGPVAAAKA